MARLIFSLFTIALLCCACQGSDETPGRTARFGENNRYYIYTRDNPRNPVRVEPTAASANAVRVWHPKTVMVIHDLRGGNGLSLNPTVKDALLTAENVTVLIVDWSIVANSDPGFAVAASPQIGEGVANLLRVLISTRKVTLENLHIVGFGIGAHIAGFAARPFITTTATTTTRVARITALDPSAAVRVEPLGKNDANYVEVIHTSDSGIIEAIGHVDFFPSGGLQQTGCENDNQCNHDRAWELFAASLTHNSLEGNKCPLDSNPGDRCKGYTLNMGNNQLIKYGEGTYFLEASDTYPYDSNCMAVCT